MMEPRMTRGKKGRGGGRGEENVQRTEQEKIGARSEDRRKRREGGRGKQKRSVEESRREVWREGRRGRRK